MEYAVSMSFFQRYKSLEREREKEKRSRLQSLYRERKKRKEKEMATGNEVTKLSLSSTGAFLPKDFEDGSKRLKS